ncbi:MAG: 3-hydroxyacyl-ACP dehydratase FabZ [Candidatus Omnitrophota bacterium]|nr:3-hydroxyacyl-ACP dehydratase FabZ [Candidatus Omnitrophota bacterium]
MDNVLDIEKIQELLPQRFPFLLIDRIVELAPAQKVVALKNVSINEGFFSGHFPGRPVMPGAMLIEAMIQASMVMFYSGQVSAVGRKPLYSLSSMKAKFVYPVFAGDQVRITVTAGKSAPGAAMVSAVASVEGKETVRAELIFRSEL